MIQRRGYALPLVFLLSMVVAFSLTLFIERNAAKTRNVQRQLAAYQSHHMSKGLQEAISAWLSTQNARTVADALGEGGHAVDIAMPDRSVLSVFLRDGQGTLLEPLSASSTDYTDILSIRQRLDLFCRTEQLKVEEYVRPIGPSAVSALSADRVVLRAVADHLVGPESAEEFANRVLEKRVQAARLQRNDLITIATEMELSNEVRTRMLSLLSVQPELWYVTIEVRGGGGASSSRLRGRYGGLVPIRSTTGAQGGGGSWEQPGVFLTWEDLGVELDSQEGAER